VRQPSDRGLDRVGQKLLVAADGLDIDQLGGQVGRGEGKIQIHSGKA